MANSKALQTREWWEEVMACCGSRRVVCRTLPYRTRSRFTIRRQKVNRRQAEPDPLWFAEQAKGTIEATRHAECRKAQRNLSDRDIDYVLSYGQTLHKAGAVFTCLREKDIPYADQTDSRCQKLIGTVVVMTTEGERRVLTAYRNRRNGLRHIKRKPDYTRSREITNQI